MHVYAPRRQKYIDITKNIYTFIICLDFVLGFLVNQILFLRLCRILQKTKQTK